MHATLLVENGDTLKSIQGLLRRLLEVGEVDALMVPMRTLYRTIAHTLVTNPELLAAADPLAPVLTGNGATLAGRLSVREPRARVGVVLRSCELRALVELTKMKQADLKDLTLIAIDCAGAYGVPAYQRLAKSENAGELWQELFKSPEAQKAELRSACKICEKPTFDAAAITIELLGSDDQQGVSVSLPDELGQKLGLSPTAPNGRAQAVEKLVAARMAQRDAEFAAISQRLEGEEGIAGVFAACIRCHNCMTVCPICYCKTCVFKSAVFDHEPMQFVSWARQKGACRLPTDTVLFHLTRLNHMVLSCVGCGMCSEACPSELPVGVVFRAIGQNVQATFDYMPGRSPDDALPLTTFQADEWTEVGE